MMAVAKLSAMIALVASMAGCQTAGRIAMQAPRMVICGIASGTVGLVVSSRPSRRSPRRPERGNRRPAARTDTSAHLMDRVTALYDRCEYARCLDEARNVAKRPTTPPRQRAAAHVHIGVILLMKGHDVEAVASFRQAHQLDPTYGIDRQRFKPAVVACYENAIHNRRP